MIRFRHRRRLRLIHVLAAAGPAVAIGLLGTAYALDGRWLWVAAAGGALVSLLLGGAVFRLDHRWRREYAIGRAAQAARFTADHERLVTEHRSFTAHMAGLLDAAAEQITVQRSTVDLLEAELAELRSRALAESEPEPVHTESQQPGQELALLGDAAEWRGFWPDLADIPTVVDIVAWDERTQAERAGEPADEIVERSA